MEEKGNGLPLCRRKPGRCSLPTVWDEKLFSRGFIGEEDQPRNGGLLKGRMWVVSNKRG